MFVKSIYSDQRVIIIITLNFAFMKVIQFMPSLESICVALEVL